MVLILSDSNGVLAQFRAQVPKSVSILAVTKSASIEQMRQLYRAGFHTFGENRVQEIARKKALLQDLDIQWHLIGHLQTNKAQKAVELCDCIQSVDSLKIAAKINECAAKLGKIMPILLELNLTEEPQKFGFDPIEFDTILISFSQFKHLEIKGLMVMGPNTDDTKYIEKIFAAGKCLYEQLKTMYTSANVLSMGMSHDYKLAIKNGASQIRIGAGLVNLIK